MLNRPFAAPVKANVNSANPRPGANAVLTMPSATPPRPGEVGHPRVAAVAARAQRADHEPEAVHADEHREAGRAHLQVLLGQHELADVHRRRAQRDRRRRGDHRPHDPVAQHAAQVRRGVLLRRRGHAPHVTPQPAAAAAPTARR